MSALGIGHGAAPGGVGGAWFLAREDLGLLINLLREDGRRLIGPTIEDEAVVYDEITSVAQLPAGWRTKQEPGKYRIEHRDSDRLFDYVIGPTAWKRFTYPPRVPLTIGRKDGSQVSFADAEPDAPPLAFLGVRACELAALGIQDRVFLGGPYIEEDYRVRRRNAIVVAVQCTTSNSTCFCTSMASGPEVRGGHDLALTELESGFVLEVGSEAGSRLLERLPVAAATIDQAVEAAREVAAVRASIGDPVATAGLRDRLMTKLDSPRWAEIAERCLSCANCTLVCPTCFCVSVGRATDLDGEEAISERVWDSCFNGNFAKVAGGNFRPKVKDRYRQWLTHKFATWWDQFGSAGCVGCGRCITWCPVGIDVREELMIIAPATPAPPPPPAIEPARVVRQEYVTATITGIRDETPDTRTLAIRGLDEGHSGGRPGQFVMAALPAFPPAAISVSRYLPPDGIELTIRAAGPATTAITSMKPGDTIGIRGPVGVGWPIEVAHGKDVVIISGGTGLAPIRGVIDHILANREQFGAFRIYYGARTADDMLFKDELAAWDAREDVEVICRWLKRGGRDAKAGPGRSTVSAIHQDTWDGENTIAYVCGAERMMEAAAIALAGHGVTPDRVFVTLERHMECGVGLCGHCQMGRFFVCKDGPVFPLTELDDVFGREGI